MLILDTIRENFIKHEKILLLALIICMVAMGLSVMYLASYYHSLRYYGVDYYYVLRQSIYVIIGFLTFFLVQKINITKYLKWPYFFIALAVILPLIPLILGHRINGASRWIFIYLPGIDRLAIHTGLWSLILLVIGVLILNASNRSWTKLEKIITASAFAWIGILLLQQPDLAMFILLFATSIYYLFKNGKNKTALALMACMVLIIGYWIYFGPLYAQGRILRAYDYSLTDINNYGYQISWSRFGFWHGQWLGAGLSNVLTARLNLPWAFDGFIFAVLAEAFGVLGVACYLAAIIAFVYFGLRAAAQTQNMLEADTIKFLVYLIVAFAFLHIAVTIHLLPLFEAPLPYFSYGGIFMLICLFASGLIYKNLKGNSEIQTIIFDLKKPLSLAVLFVAAILFVHTIYISHIYFPFFDDYLRKPNDLIDCMIK